MMRNNVWVTIRRNLSVGSSKRVIIMVPNMYRTMNFHTTVNRQDVVQDLYLRELKSLRNGKGLPSKEELEASLEAAKQWTAPGTPTKPTLLGQQEEESLLKSYKDQEVETTSVKKPSDVDAEDAETAENEDWLVLDDMEEGDTHAHAAH
ncbi:F1F0 ATP synthase subunit h NDAI_0D02660 [Naumovozyma dairenensis CBS 421]|uniref:Uncharacterized protein n=1 Tax=Naumovozyma dairenensis (strain ATCC 10597 / BCRC 20456 / CBS 421 / NBRC 0211 / NRRL Y-12639) TaxID=1071378 RepID=G0W9W9_NAUDC|nr:hypothetical protein NDAI_0D02660 [Naumovozyma dairenensis CBS 421]CCD24580.1 hypothetical protein NDAI_0D02660 [Naumovozyma dairenensis CBS 421]